MTKREIIEAMDADAENPEITLEQFVAKVEEVNAKQNAENTFTNITKEDINNMIKEDKTMMNINEIKTTFVFENRTYTEKTNGYCFVTENGKTRRIKAAELEQAFDSYIQAGADAAAQAELDEEPCMVEVENDLDKPAVLNENGCVDCRGCNVEYCVHRDCMRRNPRNVGGLGECPRLGNPLLKPEYVDPNDPANAYPDELDNAMEKLGYHRIDGEWNDFRYATNAHEVMAWNTVEEGLKWVKEQVAGDGTPLAEVGKEIAEQAKKKAKRVRKSKDVGFEHSENGKTMVTLTAKQVDFIRHLPDTCYWEHGLNSSIFVDCLCDDIGGQFENKPMTVGAMISTLCEKGLGSRVRDTSRKGKPIVFALTEMGKRIAKELGLD